MGEVFGGLGGVAHEVHEVSELCDCNSVLVVFQMSSALWICFGLEVLSVLFEKHSDQEVTIKAAELQIVFSASLSAVEMKDVLAQTALCNVLFAAFKNWSEAFSGNEQAICDYLVAEIGVLAISRRK